MDEPSPEINRTKVRFGLAIVALVVVVSGVLFFAIDDPIGKAVMFAVAVAGMVRVFLLTRAIRSDPGS